MNSEQDAVTVILLAFGIPVRKYDDGDEWVEPRLVNGWSNASIEDVISGWSGLR